jgi:hypothetical protein
MMTEKIRRRMVMVGLAPVAAIVTWAAVRLAGGDFVIRGGHGTVGPGDVWWPLVGSTVLGFSLIGPSYLADGVDALALSGLHIVTAIVLIGASRRRSRGTTRVS